MNVTGVLTYDDVTSVDSVGIVTARQGFRATGGTTVLGANSTGFTPHTSSWATNSALRLLGNYGGGLTFSDNGNNGYSVYVDSSGVNFYIKNGAVGGGLNTSIKCVKDGTVELYHNGSKKFETTAYGTNTTGTAVNDGMVVAGVSTHTGAVNVTSADGISIDTSGYAYLNFESDRTTATDNIGGPLFKNASGTVVSKIQSLVNGTVNVIGGAGSELMISAIKDAAVELYHNGIKNCETNGAGISLFGQEGGDCVLDMNADEGDDNSDKWRINISQGGSFQLKNYADGSWENHIQTTVNSAVELYHNGTKKFETASNGIVVTGGVTADAFSVGDSETMTFGASGDLSIQHNGSHSYISDVGTGDLRITGSAVHIQNACLLYTSPSPRD